MNFIAPLFGLVVAAAPLPAEKPEALYVPFAVFYQDHHLTDVVAYPEALQTSLHECLEKVQRVALGLMEDPAREADKVTLRVNCVPVPSSY